MPSVTFLQLSDVSVICRVTSFSVSNSCLLFFHVCQPGRTSAFTQYRTSDIAENFGRFIIAQGNDFILVNNGTKIWFSS